MPIVRGTSSHSIRSEHIKRVEEPLVDLSQITDAVSVLEAQQSAEAKANADLLAKMSADYDRKLQLLLEEQKKLQLEKESVPKQSMDLEAIKLTIQKNELKIKTMQAKQKATKKSQKFANLSAGKPANSK